MLIFVTKACAFAQESSHRYAKEGILNLRMQNLSEKKMNTKELRHILKIFWLRGSRRCIFEVSLGYCSKVVQIHLLPA